MLKYFFRGKIEITAPDEYVYAIIDGSSPTHEFTHIKAKVKNITTIEEDASGNPIYEDMGTGTLTLQRYLMFFDKFSHTFLSMRQIGTMVPVLDPNDLFDHCFQAVPFHGQQYP